MRPVSRRLTHLDGDEDPCGRLVPLPARCTFVQMDAVDLALSRMRAAAVVMLGLVAPFSLVAGCSGGNEPLATATAANSPSPVTPQTSSLPGYGHSPGTSTGNPTLDGVVTALLGPASGVEQRLVLTPTACVAEPKGTGELPKCPAGTVDGTTIDIFRATDCDAAEPDSVALAIRSLAAQPRGLFAVYRSQP